jgi:hypothetical protein
MSGSRGVVIQGLDLIDIVKFAEEKSKKYSAMCLSDLELVLPKDSEQYKEVRKIVLDTFNNYKRSLLRVIVGDVEYLIGK